MKSLFSFSQSFFLDFSRPDQFEFSFDELIRTLHNSSLFEKPQVSSNPFVSTSQTPPNRVGDGVLQVIRCVVNIFEKQTWDHVSYSELIAKAKMSRIMFDIYVDQARSQDLLTQDNDKDVILTAKGKVYAIQHGLIS
ncbi:hypothetical protein LL972_16455 [Xanthomonas campestris pv. asclepiadis]|uniref:hypothetical protein n=1 Tax=Xanthomonas campestris TaxID=339 RepID=UPI001E3E17CD|nr:hypothetical protein [Xanthomonas campestris]MCC4617571.1 hypothetical protein [Xanthomonas campestris pv. asclepiadis]